VYFVRSNWSDYCLSSFISLRLHFYVLSQKFPHVIQSSDVSGVFVSINKREKTREYLRAVPCIWVTIACCRFISSEIPCHGSVDHPWKAYVYTSPCPSSSTPSSFTLLRRARLARGDSRRECTLFSDEAREHFAANGGKPVVRLLIARCISVDRHPPLSLFVYRVARKRRSVWRRRSSWTRPIVSP